MKPAYSLILLLLCTITLINGCNSTAKSTNTSKPVSTNKTSKLHQYYLKGSLTQWAINKDYKLERIRSKQYATAANLTKGETVQWLFSAEDASQPKGNCGYLDAKDQQLKLDKKVKASCNNIVLQNFSFTPQSTGMYEFFIDFARPSVPMVYVRRVY
ncbi:MAG: hypothetical protein ACI8WB_000981 [Phenylobacterium sp.]|jgi:uncharacterized protein YceK